MPRRVKPQVATVTEKRKAELFNQVDDLIAMTQWGEALEILQYLYRTTPSQRPVLIQKLAVIYQNTGEPETALKYLHKLLPSSNFTLNRMVLEALLSLKLRHQALQQLAKAPLTRSEKAHLFSLIDPQYKERSRNPPPNRVMLRCPACTGPQFFRNGQLECLMCSDSHDFPKSD